MSPLDCRPPANCWRVQLINLDSANRWLKQHGSQWESAPLSSRSLSFSLNISVHLAASARSSPLRRWASSELSPADGGFDRSPACKGLWGRHGSSQAIKQLHSLKEVPSTFNRVYVCVHALQVCGFFLWQVDEAAWTDEKKAAGVIVEKGFQY